MNLESRFAQALRSALEAPPVPAVIEHRELAPALAALPVDALFERDPDTHLTVAVHLLQDGIERAVIVPQYDAADDIESAVITPIFEEAQGE